MKVMVFGLALLLTTLDVCAQRIQTEPLTSLPRPVSNNAMALVSTGRLAA